MWNSNRRFQIMKKNPLPTHRRGKCTHRKDAHSQWKKKREKGEMKEKPEKHILVAFRFWLNGQPGVRCPVEPGFPAQSATRRDKMRRGRTRHVKLLGVGVFLLSDKEIETDSIEMKWNEKKKGWCGDEGNLPGPICVCFVSVAIERRLFSIESANLWI